MTTEDPKEEIYLLNRKIHLHLLKSGSAWWANWLLPWIGGTLVVSVTLSVWGKENGPALLGGTLLGGVFLSQIKPA